MNNKVDINRPVINTIQNMDALEFLSGVPDEYVDLIFVDPWYYPENQKTKNAFEDDTFWEMTEKWLKELNRVIKRSGHMFVSFSSQKMAKFEFLLAKLSIPLKSRIVWHYRNAGGRCADKGQFGKTYEMIYHLGYADKLYFSEKWDDKRFDVWTIAIPQSNFKDKKVHPHQKPEELLRRIITLGSKKGDLVLDCFMGSGTTAYVALFLQRNFIGCEINPEYCKIAEARLKKVPRRLDKFV